MTNGGKYPARGEIKGAIDATTRMAVEPWGREKEYLCLSTVVFETGNGIEFPHIEDMVNECSELWFCPHTERNCGFDPKSRASRRKRSRRRP